MSTFTRKYDYTQPPRRWSLKDAIERQTEGSNMAEGQLENLRDEIEALRGFVVDLASALHEVFPDKIEALLTDFDKLRED